MFDIFQNWKTKKQNTELKYLSNLNIIPYLKELTHFRVAWFYTEGP